MNDKPKSVVTKKDVPTNEVPDKFPKDIPVEADAKITQNYNATSVDGTFQATRVFETKKTLDANFKIYQDYLKNNNWKIESTVNQPEYKMLYASSGASTIQIAMNDNKVAKVSTIDISYADKSATKPAAKTAAPTPAATPAANTAPKATK